MFKYILGYVDDHSSPRVSLTFYPLQLSTSSPLKVGKVSVESCSAALDALEDAIAQELLEQGTNKNWIQFMVNWKVSFHLEN